MREGALDLLMRAADWAVERIPVQNMERPKSCEKLRLIAHRGAWRERGCLENTFSAFDRAREVGIWGLEFDVRFTKDDVAVVHHDDSLLRTFGRPTKISKSTLSTLSHEAKEIPKLKDVIGEYSTNFHFFIEIKNSNQELTDTRLGEILSPLVQQGLKPIQNFHFMSFDFDVLRRLSGKMGVPKEALVSIAELNVESISSQTLAEGFGGFSCHWLTMTNSIIKRHHEKNQKCGVGFLNSQTSLLREWARGIDWAFTNEAVKACQWLDEISK